MSKTSFHIHFASSSLVVVLFFIFLCSFSLATNLLRSKLIKTHANIATQDLKPKIYGSQLSAKLVLYSRFGCFHYWGFSTLTEQAGGKQQQPNLCAATHAEQLFVLIHRNWRQLLVKNVMCSVGVADKCLFRAEFFSTLWKCLQMQ